MTGAVQRLARATPGHEQRISAALTRLRQAAAEHAPRIVQATSLGAEDMVITDMIARHGLPIALATLETGALHAETLALIARLESHYGLSVERWQPQAQAVVEFVQRHGERAMRQSQALRKACCQVRKLEPLSRMLHGRQAWITGLRKEQSDARSSVQAAVRDEQGRIKFSPLVDWTWADVWQYIGHHAVPYNPLHDAFYPSIGCAPCTRAVAMGEDARAGRWWWESDSARECGLHAAVASQPEAATP